MLMFKQIWFDFDFEVDVHVVVDHVFTVITVFAIVIIMCAYICMKVECMR